MKGRKYLQEVAKALADCQAIELALKAYISEALNIVEALVSQHHTFAFKFKGADYEEASLEKLIDVFRKLSDNEDLVRQLRQFKDKRNFLAHKAIVKCLEKKGKLDEWQTAGTYASINTIQRDARRMLEAIFKEHMRFRIYKNIPVPPVRRKRQA